MIIKFDYRCRRCGAEFQDPGKPEIDVPSVAEAEVVLYNSLNRNPTAKTRVGVTETHMCDTGTIGDTVGIGDLIGYRILAPTEQQAPDTKVLKMVRNDG